MQKYLIIYFLLINILSFLIFGLDKYKAVRNYYRISENTLFTLTAIGGFVGSILGMTIFAHKTVKLSFLWKFFVIIFIWVVILVYLLINYT